MPVKTPEELERRTLSIEDENQNFVFFFFATDEKNEKVAKYGSGLCWTILRCVCGLQ